MLTIGICGASGSGKTTLAQELMNRLDSSAILIHQDAYYRDHSHLPMEERKKINYDHPEVFDHELLYEDIRALREGRSILKKGMAGEDVRELQEKLVKLGYDTGGTDGNYGTRTFVAVAKFQEANGLTPVDGEAGPVTMAVIDSMLDELPAAHESAPDIRNALAALAAYLQTPEFLEGFSQFLERGESNG